MWGGPSHVDLFDPKPRLAELNGQSLPDSLVKNAQFAFVKKETARLKASPFKFDKCGQSGIEFSDLLPHFGSCADDIALMPHAPRRVVQSSPGANPAQHRFHPGWRSAGRFVAALWFGKSK